MPLEWYYLGFWAWSILYWDLYMMSIYYNYNTSLYNIRHKRSIKFTKDLSNRNKNDLFEKWMKINVFIEVG